MKKLLSLLSVLTISGTAVPTTIAASSYEKEETIKNSEINYSQNNNLEILNRNKRNNDGLQLTSKTIREKSSSGFSIGGEAGLELNLIIVKPSAKVQGNINKSNEIETLEKYDLKTQEVKM